MRIDSHQHFWCFDAARDDWITDEMSALKRDFLPEDLAPHLRTSRLDGSIAVQADQSEDETAFLLQLAENHPFIRGVVGWVDILAPTVGERLEYFSQAERFCGVRHIAQAEAEDFLAREDVACGIGLLSDFGLTYDLLVYARQLPAVLKLVQRLPDTRFVVDHMAKPPIRDGRVEPWSTQMKQLALHENVWCKVSGLVTEADWRNWSHEEIRPYLDVAFEAFGPGRLMFGSDWPVCLLAATYGEVWDLVDDYASCLSETERDNLFGSNAANFYGLSV